MSTPRAPLCLTWGGAERAPLLLSAALLLAACGAAIESTSPSEELAAELTSEPLPIPPSAEEEAAAVEEEAPAAEEPAAEVPPCELEVDAPEVAAALAVFRRWLRDQAVGRRLMVESVDPRCGSQGGFLVLDVVLSGPAGGLQSLGRALTLYYPGSSWTARDYDRLEGQGVPLRLLVEVRLPDGARPRPRCAWDPEAPCEAAPQ